MLFSSLKFIFIMMRMNSILTNRTFEQFPSWHIVYEWEDLFSKLLKVPLKNENITASLTKKPGLFYRIINKLHFSELIRFYYTLKPSKDFVFFMFTPYKGNPLVLKNTIPVVIDVWSKDIDLFISTFKKNRLVYVGSLEAMNAIKSKSDINVKYLPVSISDQYKLTSYPDKDIDIIQYGRTNKDLKDWTELFVQKYPNYNYVTGYTKNGIPEYYSNKTGHFGYLNREKFNSILLRTKVSIVSSPGLDNFERTGGFNPLTPRFLEGAGNYCYMLGKFAENEDYTINKVSSVCRNVSSYSEFESILLKMLTTEFNEFEKYDNFLSKHWTSKRIEQVLDDLMLLK